MVSLADTKKVMGYLNRLEECGITVTKDMEAGTFEAKDGEVVVCKGIQKGKNGPWIVKCSNSENVKWS